MRLRYIANKYRLRSTQSNIKELPSVSVCIPARNEIHALAECLEGVLASDYSKLEVLVLDDNSADDTSLIIRSFAHAGVRFIAGEPLPAGWLGKNFSLQTLSVQASGTFILYMDVDTKLATTSISRMVDAALASNAAMISVIPDRYDTKRAGVYVGSLRYFWELLLSTRKSFPASSSAWMVKRDVLLDTIGGFEKIRTSVRPEVSIATDVANNSIYIPIVHSAYMGIGYEKKWSSQIETSRRILYQLVGGTRVKGVLAILGLLLLNLPTITMLSVIIAPWQFIHTLAAVSLLLCICMYGTYLHYTWQDRWWLGMIMWPYVIAQELVLFVMSMIGYLTHTITWKGRRIEDVSDKSIGSTTS
ncbi:MAG: glycosyltransferase family 2 protein [Candidatus Saccharimonadales bacterium]